MPSELTGEKRSSPRSGPVISYKLSDSLKESFSHFFSSGSKGETSMQEKRDLEKAVENLGELGKDEQRRVLVHMIRKGKTDEEIGEECGLTQWQVRNLRYKLGLKKDRGGNLHLEPPADDSGSQELEPRQKMDEEPVLEAPEGLLVTLKGDNKPAGQLVKRLGAIKALLAAEREDKRYQFTLCLMEVGAKNDDENLLEEGNASPQEEESEAKGGLGVADSSRGDDFNPTD